MFKDANTIGQLTIKKNTMSKKQSNTRKAKRSNESNSFAKQVERETARIKEKVSKLPKSTKIGGILLMPLMLVIWWIDRIMCLLLPHTTHPSLKEYLLMKASVKTTFARIVIFGTLPFIVWLLM